MRCGKPLTTMVVAFFLVSQGVFLSPGLSFAQSTAMKIKIGQDAPDFTLKTLEGEKVSLSSYFGKKVVMLEFWATWCNVCVKEIPTLMKDYSEFREKGFEILAITLQSGQNEEIKGIVDRYGIEYPILIDEKLHVATKVYGLAGPIPLKVVIGADGVVKYSHVGDYPPGENEIPYVVEDLIRAISK